MGGPWRAKGYDPAAWRPPVPHRSDETQSPGARVEWAKLTRIVVTYVASVVVSLVAVIGLLKQGWLF